MRWTERIVPMELVLQKIFHFLCSSILIQLTLKSNKDFQKKDNISFFCMKTSHQEMQLSIACLRTLQNLEWYFRSCYVWSFLKYNDKIQNNSKKAKQICKFVDHNWKKEKTTGNISHVSNNKRLQTLKYRTTPETHKAFGNLSFNFRSIIEATVQQ